MSRRVNQVDQETIAILLLSDVGKILVGKFIVQGDTTEGVQERERGREGERETEGKRERERERERERWRDKHTKLT